MQVVLYAGSQAERKAARKQLASAHVVVTSYSLLERADTKKYLEVRRRCAFMQCGRLVFDNGC